MTGADWVRLARRVLRPDAGRLSEAVALVADIAEPRAAWARLADHGLIRVDMVESPRRTFTCYRLDASATYPPTVAACAAFAANLAGMLAAETLAIEVEARLRPWQVGVADLGAPMIEWQLTSPGPTDAWGEPVDEPLMWAGSVALDAAHKLTAMMDVPLDEMYATSGYPARVARERFDSLDWNWYLTPVVERLVAEQAWTLAAARGLTLPRNNNLPPNLVGARFDQLPNPFEPVRSIAELGYILVIPGVLAAPDPHTD
jgi:hypothetical protein